jgi:uncharacterized membrane-anchored protein YhcB (DUF1043 family)
MNTDLSLWLLVLAGLLVGALVGAAGALIALRRGEGGAAASRRELDAYRDEVASHYAETARRVDALTHAYKAVYDHLEEGAYRLVGEDELKRRLDDASRDPVTLEGIGRRALDAGDDAPDEAGTPGPERAIEAGDAVGAEPEADEARRRTDEAGPDAAEPDADDPTKASSPADEGAADPDDARPEARTA